MDLGLFWITDSVEEAAAEIIGFYRNYHSLRYVGDRLVLRLRRPLPDDEVAALNDRLRRPAHAGARRVRDRATLPRRAGGATTTSTCPAWPCPSTRCRSAACAP